MDNHLVSYYFGISLIFIIALSMIITYYSYDNVVVSNGFLIMLGLGCIAYYFMNKEKFIKF
jgi:hypothetical protein